MRALPFALALALSAIVFAGGGCEAIVSSDVPGFTCSGTSNDRCPGGQYCKGAGCSTCEKIDVCDGYDNDCNGKVDDGPLSDKDSDTYTICGRLDPSGRFVDVDCDDNDPTIHPGAKESCNGKDDDCNGVIDDGACAPDEVCVASLKLCKKKSDVCSPASCAAPKICDTETQACVDPPSVDVGSPCTSSASCKTHICGDASVLGAVFVGKNGSICTTPCCTSFDCDPNAVCFAAGTGGSYCVPKTSQGLGRATGPLGSAAGGATCAANGDCRSGLCGRDQRCLDACCKHSDCASGATCTFNTATGHNVFECAAGAGGRGQNSTCGSDADCQSGVCFEYSSDPSVVSEKHCIESCCGSSACGSVDLGFWLNGSHTAACFDVTAQDDPRFGTDVVSACVGTTGTGGGQLGDACARGSDCRSTRCHPTAKTCTDVCCKDSDCKGSKTPDWVCRPTAVGNANWLRCGPP